MYIHHLPYCSSLVNLPHVTSTQWWKNTLLLFYPWTKYCVTSQIHTRNIFSTCCLGMPYSCVYWDETSSVTISSSSGVKLGAVSSTFHHGHHQFRRSNKIWGGLNFANARRQVKNHYRMQTSLWLIHVSNDILKNIDGVKSIGTRSPVDVYSFGGCYISKT